MTWLVAFLLLAGLVLWLHRQRPERHIVPSVLLWLDLPAGQNGATRTRRLPKLTLPLILQLMALAAMLGVLARPALGPSPAAHLVIVLDGSAPMATVFDQARGAVIGEVAGRIGAPPERVSLILAGPEPRLLAARHDYAPRAMTPLLSDETTVHGPADWPAVAALVQQVLLPDEATEGLLVSAAPPARFEVEDGPDFELLRVPSAPLLPALDLRLTEQAGGKWLLKGVLRPTGSFPANGVMLDIGFTAEADIGLRPPLPWKRITINGPDLRVSEVLDLPEPGLLTVETRADGAAGWPGATARFLTIPPSPRAVLYLAPAGVSDQPLLAGLLAAGGLELFRADALPEDMSRFALTIVDGMTLPVAPPGAVIWIGTAGVGSEDRTVATVSDADEWDRFHPLTGGSEWTAPRFGPVATRLLPPEARVLLAAEGHPLLAVGGDSQVYVRSDPRQIDWGGGPGLPVLADAIGRWLGLTGLKRQNCMTGQACAAGAGDFMALEGRGFASTTPIFRPTQTGLFRGPEGFLAVNAAPDRFGAIAEETSLPDTGQRARPLAMTQALLITAVALLAAEAALRLWRGGRRALPALIAPALAGAAIAGLPIPVPFARSVTVALVPEGGERVANMATVAAGPGPKLADNTPERAAPLITHPAGALALAEALVPPYQIAVIRPMAPVRAGETPLPLAPHAHLSAPPPPPATRGVALIALALPADALIGDRVRLTAILRSDSDLPARITLFANGTALATQEVELVPGMNRVETDLPPLSAGETRIGVMLETAGSQDTLSTIIIARPARPVLILAPDAAQGADFARRVSAGTADDPVGARAEMRVLDPAVAPDYLRDWLNYDALVTLDMPARAVNSREARLIAEAVTRHGLGLLLLGGANAFGPGGYFATPFEMLSPLSARVPREAPEVTMVFVLDRSGSMNQPVTGGANRLEIARQATLDAIGLLNPESRVGIVVFDSEARIVLPLTRAEDRETVRAALATVDTGGGTAIAPGLSAGWEMLRASDAQARHLIVMTDGLSQPGDFAGIAGRMRAEGITISAVAIGTGADAQAVRTIAAAGGGSVHATEDFTALPSILSQEAMLLSSPVREGQGQPRALDVSDPLLRGLPGTLPPIDGMVLTTAKPEARLALVTSTPEGEETPLLATWRQGAGQVLALATDAESGWTESWRQSGAMAALWPHVLRQIRPARPATGPWLSVHDTGESLHVTLEALDPEGAPREGLAPSALISPEGGGPFSLPMREGEPGIYTADMVPQALGRIGVRVALPIVARPGERSSAALPAIASTSPRAGGGGEGVPSLVPVAAPVAEEVAEATIYLSRPLWAEPQWSASFGVVGGVSSVPVGWGLRLVPGLIRPWTFLALVAFIAALLLYLRSPRRRFGHGGPRIVSQSQQGAET